MRFFNFLIASTIAATATIGAASSADAQDKKLPEVFKDDFEKGMDHWKTTDVKKKVWKIVETDRGKVLRVTGASDYRPPKRSPHSIALVKDLVVGDFELTVKVQSTSNAGNHRDMCLFWGYQDPSHFYYVHLGKKADPHACQIFIVNDKPRTAITVNTAPGTPWDKKWHDVKIVRRVDDGTMEVYFDDMKTPFMTAKDKHFVWGQVGLGTFDDHGHWDDFKLLGEKVEKTAK